MKMKPKILIIDDEFQPRGLAEEVRKQYEIEIVHQGEEGIEKVKQGAYDAVLLDCKFKRQLYQGPTIAKKIREFDKSTLVIGFSDMWKIIYDKEMVSYHGHPEVDKHIDSFDSKEQVFDKLAKYLKS